MTTTPTPAQRLDALCWSLDDRVQRGQVRPTLADLLALARIVHDLHKDAARPQERPEPAPEGDGTTDPDSGRETGAQRVSPWLEVGDRVVIARGAGARSDVGVVWAVSQATDEDGVENFYIGELLEVLPADDPGAPGSGTTTYEFVPEAASLDEYVVKGLSAEDVDRFTAALDDEPDAVEPTPDWFRRTVETWLDTPGHPDDKQARMELQWLLNRAEAGRPDLADDSAPSAPAAGPVEAVEAAQVSLPTTPGSVASTRDGGRYILTGDTDSQPWFGPGKYVSADELLALGVVGAFDAGTVA